jgi:hypothetical protein
MRRWFAVSIFLVLVISMPLIASAQKSSKIFAGSELLVGRGVKQPTGAKIFAVGLNIQFAPMNMVLGSQRDTFLDGSVAAACDGDPACEAAASENMDDALGAIKDIPDDDWEQLVATAADDAAMAATIDQMVADGVMSEDDGQAVQAMAGDLPDGESRESILTGTRLLAKQEGTSVLVEPTLEVNLKPVSLNLRIPMAVVMFDSNTDLFGNSTRWSLGNITLDAKFGHTFGSRMAALGIGYGVSLYAPTGTSEAGSMALADLWFGPKFMHGYLTLAPFLAAGFDSLIVSLQVHGELVSQHYVRGSQQKVVEGDRVATHVMYGKYGAGVIVMPNWPVSIIGEINGLFPLVDAAAYRALFGLAGIQLKLFWLKAAVAGQFPIIAPAPEELGAIGGVSLGQLASYSIITRAAIVF